MTALQVLRNLSRREVLAGGVGLAAVAAVGTQARAGTPPRTITYGPNPGQVMDVYGGTSRSAPWVIVVHGGGWAGGTKGQTARTALKLAAKGYRVFNVEYRPVPAVSWAAQLGDINAAIAHIHNRAGQYGINPDRGVIYGFSAGGHLAMSAGLSTTWVRGVISVAGVLQPDRVEAVANSDSGTGFGGDLPTPQIRTLAGWQAVAMGAPYKTGIPVYDARWRTFLPALRLGDGKPLLLFQGSDDMTVPRGTLRGFRNVARAKGHETVAWEKAGGQHTETVAFDGAAHEQMLTEWLATNTAPRRQR